jgi:hypothetical protein
LGNIEAKKTSMALLSSKEKKYIDIKFVFLFMESHQLIIFSLLVDFDESLSLFSNLETKI